MSEKTAKKKTAPKKTATTASKSKVAKAPAKSATAKKSPAKAVAKKTAKTAPKKAAPKKASPKKASKTGFVARAKRALSGKAGVVLAGAAVGAVLEVVREVNKASKQGKSMKPRRIAGKTLEGAVGGAVAAMTPTAIEEAGKPEVPAILDIATGERAVAAPKTKKKKPAKKK